MNSIHTTAVSADTGTMGAVVQRTISTEEHGAPNANTPSTDATNAAGTLGAIVFWVFALGIGLFFYVRGHSADVFLNVVSQSSSADAAAKSVPTSVEGSVLVDGTPVTNGRLQISVYDSDRKSYMAGAVVQTSDGTFKTTFGLPADATSRRLRVDAKYVGFVESEGQRQEIVGDVSRFVRAPEPLATTRVATGLCVLAGLIILLIILFTGELTRPKARLLFVATYFMTFIALALPIALTVLLTRNPYLADIMREAPIGLVKGVSGVTVRDEQWLLNIGGTVRTETRGGPTPSSLDVGAGSAAPAAVTPGGQTAATALTGSSGASTGGSIPVATSTGPVQASPLPWAMDGNGPTPSLVDNVDGGLVVPFYILILATFGAGINMTRQVPKIQSVYDEKITPRRESVLIATLHAPLKLFQYAAITDPSEREAAAHTRRQLIDNFMYLLAAPFLAIAVYYLLQVLAENTAEPVLVLMAFSTGLVSDAIVSRITSFAEGTIAGVTGNSRPAKDRESPDVENSPRQLESQSPPPASPTLPPSEPVAHRVPRHEQPGPQPSPSELEILRQLQQAKPVSDTEDDDAAQLLALAEDSPDGRLEQAAPAGTQAAR